jgi:hypothetical protein
MTDSKQEPKIIDGFDRIEFLVDGEWKQIPSQQMLEALVHFPKPDAPDPYNLEHYRQKFNLRNRQYDSEESKQILRGWSNLLINGYANHLNMSFCSQYLQEYKPKIKYITHPFEVDEDIVYFSVDGDKVVSINGESILPTDPNPNLIEDTAKILQWFVANNLSYEKYVYADVMTKYCYAILPMTTSRYTAISGKLEIAERKSILGIELEDDERSYLEKTELFVASLERRFSDFRNVFKEYKETHQQMSQDKNIRYILDNSLNESAKQIRKDKANKSRREKELEIEIKIVSQCIFCYKFHYQTTKKRTTKKGKSDNGKGGKGKTSLTRYCPDCEYYCHQWADDKYTPDRRGIPLSGW